MPDRPRATRKKFQFEIRVVCTQRAWTPSEDFACTHERANSTRNPQDLWHANREPRKWISAPVVPSCCVKCNAVQKFHLQSSSFVESPRSLLGRLADRVPGVYKSQYISLSMWWHILLFWFEHVCLIQMDMVVCRSLTYYLGSLLYGNEWEYIQLIPLKMFCAKA